MAPSSRHVVSEAADGGPLALVQNGDMIELTPGRRLHLDVSDEELASSVKPPGFPVPKPQGGYAQLYVEHVTQADEGVDFDFLRGCRGSGAIRINSSIIRASALKLNQGACPLVTLLSDYTAPIHPVSSKEN